MPASTTMNPPGFHHGASQPSPEAKQGRWRTLQKQASKYIKDKRDKFMPPLPGHIQRPPPPAPLAAALPGGRPSTWASRPPSPYSRGVSPTPQGRFQRMLSQSQLGVRSLMHRPTLERLSRQTREPSATDGSISRVNSDSSLASRRTAGSQGFSAGPNPDSASHDRTHRTRLSTKPETAEEDENTCGSGGRQFWNVNTLRRGWNRSRIADSNVLDGVTDATADGGKSSPTASTRPSTPASAPTSTPASARPSTPASAQPQPAPAPSSMPASAQPPSAATTTSSTAADRSIFYDQVRSAINDYRAKIDEGPVTVSDFRELLRTIANIPAPD